MNVTRLFLGVLPLVAVAPLIHSSSVEGAPGELIGGPQLRIALNPSPKLVDVSPASLEPLSEAEARKANLAAEFSTEPLEAARPMMLPSGSGSFAGRASAADCLTAAVYYEAATEAGQGKRAVAQVVLNRVRHPAFPNSVCEVIMQGAGRTTGCQFTFTCDGSLYRRPSRHGWESARQIALAALSGMVEPSVGLATHYHANYVRPYWSSSLDKVAAIGTHIFYRWPGGWGRSQAFNQSVALDRDYDVHRAARWGLAASYLFDSGEEQSDAAFRAPENSLSPLPDASPVEEDAERSKARSLANSPLRADREQGTLLVDEASGTLIVD